MDSLGKVMSAVCIAARATVAWTKDVPKAILCVEYMCHYIMQAHRSAHASPKMDTD